VRPELSRQTTAWYTIGRIATLLGVLPLELPLEIRYPQANRPIAGCRALVAHQVATQGRKLQAKVGWPGRCAAQRVARVPP
jgi:hypothetical protein